MKKPSDKGKDKPKDSQPKSRDVHKERKKKTKFWYYEKMGHAAKACRKKKANLKRKRECKGKENPKSDSANVTTSELCLTEYCSAYTTIAREQRWYVDSNASMHISIKEEWFRSHKGVPPDSEVTVGDDWTCHVKDVGSVPFIITTGSEENLLPVSQMVKHKMSVFLKYGKVTVSFKDTCDLVAQGKEEHGLYRLSTLLVHGDSCCSRLPHKRFEHVRTRLGRW